MSNLDESSELGPSSKREIAGRVYYRMDRIRRVEIRQEGERSRYQFMRVDRADLCR